MARHKTSVDHSSCQSQDSLLVCLQMHIAQLNVETKSTHTTSQHTNETADAATSSHLSEKYLEPSEAVATSVVASAREKEVEAHVRETSSADNFDEIEICKDEQPDLSNIQSAKINEVCAASLLYCRHALFSSCRLALKRAFLLFALSCGP